MSKKPQKTDPGNLASVADLVPDPANRRKHTARNVDMIVTALRSVGASRSIVIDEKNEILAGNGVIEAAAQAGISKLQVVDVEGDTIVAVRRRGLTDTQKRELAIYDNRTAELAEWDIDQLRADVNAGLDLQPFFFPDEVAILLGEAIKPGRTDPDEVPAERPTGIVSGDLFELGQHRLLCGDCTVAADVGRLMGNELADAGVTSPPYNAGATGFSGGYKNSPVGRVDREPFYRQVDARTSEEYVAFLSRALAVTAGHVKPNAPVLWNTCYNAKSRHEYGRVVFAPTNPLVVRETIVWDKGVGMNIATAGILSRTCEFVFLLCQVPEYYTNQGPHDTWWNVWRISNRTGGNQEHGHGASFPVGLADEAITRFSIADGVIYEPFGGSGTVIVSCEQHRRRGRAVEIEPTYCQVIIDRWEAFTGQKAVKVGSVSV